MVGGLMDPTIGRGAVDAGGTLLFKGARKQVPLRRIVVKTKRSPLVARVGGSQLKVATATGLGFKRSGFDSVFSVKQLKLTEKVATRLNKKLRPPIPFAANQLIGRLITVARPSTVSILPEGVVTVQLSDEFAAKLNSLFVAANPIFPAEHQGNVFTFPFIPEGALSPTGGSGLIKTGGSIEFLQLPQKGQVIWHEFYADFAAFLVSPEVDIEPSPPYRGKAGRLGVASFPPGTPLTPDGAALTISAGAIPLSLQPETAADLNSAFAAGADVFSGGESLGTLSFVAKGQ
ncbi:MAG TPA: hypothetical protein VNM38_07155 [Solirubrobacterales bacterium]|nr:hypothetical protein [Solirubrobacterales bacterium]